MGRNNNVNCRVKNGSWRGSYIQIHNFTNLYQQKMTTRIACKWSNYNKSSWIEFPQFYIKIIISYRKAMPVPFHSTTPHSD